ncbi:MAG: glycosyl hydrolase [Phycisphaerae bacterium]
MSDNNAIQQQWSNPSSQYRSAPFWSWNGKLEPERLKRAVRSMHAAGMGGFFMHSRYGLKTPYMSEQWFECVKACIEQARQLDMKAYLYDEDRWPSGTAGGAVTREHPEYGVHLLRLSFADRPAEGTQRLAVFHIRRDAEGQLESYEPSDPDTAPNSETGTVAFDVVRQEPSGWHNDGAYLDEMNPQAVAEFIRLTHQAYADRYAEDFGDLIPAIFTDEPNVVCEFWDAQPDKWALPWTPDMPRQFIQRHGYDLLAHLPELLFQAPDEPFSKVRHDFWQTVCELFVEAFSQQIGQWCDHHKLASTGHMLQEQTLRTQAERVGATMPHYEHMQWPGIDILRDSDEELITAKQCSSVAAQLGKERTLSELYGCTGWDWPMEGHKFIGDWHVSAGINFRCPHLTHYGLAGGAKRDYPASIFSHSPWWSHYQIVEDYFARLNLFATSGQPIREVLVIHPIESGWATLLPSQGHQGQIDHLHEQLRNIVYRLSAEHYDWDFGDESIMARHGKVSSGKLEVGRMQYRAVIVPPCLTLRSSTVELLESFIQAGGSVIVAGPRPRRVNCEPAKGVLSAAKGVSDNSTDVIDALQRVLPRRLSIRSGDRQADHVWSAMWKLPEGSAVFIHSRDRENPTDLTMQLAGDGPVVLWDALTGRKAQIPFQQDNGGVLFDLHLPSTGSALLTVGWDVDEVEPARAEPIILDSRRIKGPWPIERTEPNTLPLDSCSYRIGDGQWSQPVATLKADEAIRKHFGLSSRAARGHQPWYLYGTGVIDTKPRGQCGMRWVFHVSEVPGVCNLAVENPEDYRITVNGQTVGRPSGWWVDQDISTIDITSLVQQGLNIVEWQFDYRPDMELEDMFLVGEFGVALRDESDGKVAENYTITAPPQSLQSGSWVGQGLDFYGGAVHYRLTVSRPEDKRLRLSLPGIACTMAVVHVGDAKIPLPWAPFEVDLTDFLDGDSAEVVVEVIGGRKNTLGPLHTEWVAWTGPGEFDPNHPKWQQEYQLVDHGLIDGPVVEITD